VGGGIVSGGTVVRLTRAECLLVRSGFSCDETVKIFAPVARSLCAVTASLLRGRYQRFERRSLAEILVRLPVRPFPRPVFALIFARAT
jgi:hypothetical protein